MVAGTFDCDYFPGWFPAGDERFISIRAFYLFIILNITALVTIHEANIFQ